MKNQDPYMSLYLDEMLSACDRILSYTVNMTFEAFAKDSLVLDAVARNFEVLGEAGNHLPYSFKKKNKQIPWSSMYSLRNHISHEYFDVEPEILWEIIVNDLPHNIHDIRNLLSSSRK